jgi:hypothetical protein
MSPVRRRRVDPAPEVEHGPERSRRGDGLARFRRRISEHEQPVDPVVQILDAVRRRPNADRWAAVPALESCMSTNERRGVLSAQLGSCRSGAMARFGPSRLLCGRLSAFNARYKGLPDFRAEFQHRAVGELRVTNAYNSLWSDCYATTIGSRVSGRARCNLRAAIICRACAGLAPSSKLVTHPTILLACCQLRRLQPSSDDGGCVSPPRRHMQ